MSYSVGEIAAMSGVSTRTLRHYDDIGLVTPSGRTDAGYRRYDDDDVDRLQQVLFYRELGVRLDRIAAILDDPHTDRRRVLAEQRQMLRERRDRLTAMVALIDKELDDTTMPTNLTAQEKLEVFGDWEPPARYQEFVARLRAASGVSGAGAGLLPADKTEWMAFEKRRRSIALAWRETMARQPEAGSQEAQEFALRFRKALGLSADAQRALLKQCRADGELFEYLVRSNEQVPGMLDWLGQMTN